MALNLKVGLAEMLCNGVIMDVVTPDQARIAEDAGAVAVMALERVPSQIRKEGGVARMTDPKLIEEIKSAVTIPVMAKVRIGHTAEAQILEAIGIDFIDESEVLTPADPALHIQKGSFKTPFVCGALDLGQALRRIHEGAALIRTKGEAGTGDVIEAVRHMRQINSELAQLLDTHNQDLLIALATTYQVPLELIKHVQSLGKLPVPNFAAGGISTPADAALMRQLGAEAVFVGSGIFTSEDPKAYAKAIVQATTFFADPDVLLKASRGLGRAMFGTAANNLQLELSKRGY
jgi:pyridoxal 5'-phosphate synthase pdxS subunit